jgi:hypothetical protein
LTEDEMSSREIAEVVGIGATTVREDRSARDRADGAEVIRTHQSLAITDENGKAIKRTPAMAAGVADHVWTLREIAELLG